MIKTFLLIKTKKRIVLLYSILGFFNLATAQSYQTLDALSDFKNAPINWEIVGDVMGSPTDNNLTAKTGKGVLFCKSKEGDNLVSNLEHGDLDLSFDVMIPKGSNSGVYLQGRYEVQISDSWGIAHPSFSDAGGIYQRWDDARGKNNEGYEGHAPRVNAFKAPGLWNHVEISFIAPRFDASGKKISNARFAKITWNDQVIHQNVELLGSTRAAASSEEKALGALLLQGDHGVVAYKNMRITRLGNASVTLSAPVKYEIYENAYTRAKIGTIEDKPKIKDLTTLKPVKSGEQPMIDASISKRGVQYYVFTGKFKVNKTADYDFKGKWEGYGSVWIDDALVLSDENAAWYGFSYGEETLGKKTLSEGEHTFRIGYAHRDWAVEVRAMALFVKSDKEGWQALHAKQSELEYSSTILNEIQPTNQPVFQRSFVYFDNKKRTHAMNVGFPEGVNYSYDTKQGALLHVWRGGFLNTTPMWHGRGHDQVGAPMGVSNAQTGRFSLIDKTQLTNILEPELRYEGMNIVPIDGQDTPQYSYTFQGLKIKDWTLPTKGKTGLQRVLSMSAKPSNLNVLLATATKGIQKVSADLYAINGSEYFIKLPINTVVTMVEKDGKTLLMAELKETSFAYDIVF